MFWVRAKKRRSPGNTGRIRHFSANFWLATSLSFAFFPKVISMKHTGQHTEKVPTKKEDRIQRLSQNGLCVVYREKHHLVPQMVLATLFKGLKRIFWPRRMQSCDTYPLRVAK